VARESFAMARHIDPHLFDARYTALCVSLSAVPLFLVLLPPPLPLSGRLSLAALASCVLPLQPVQPCGKQIARRSLPCVVRNWMPCRTGRRGGPESLAWALSGDCVGRLEASQRGLKWSQTAKRAHDGGRRVTGRKGSPQHEHC
jgi:hypothetical protein